jgi:hypothetical protein
MFLSRCAILAPKSLPFLIKSSSVETVAFVLYSSGSWLNEMYGKGEIAVSVPIFAKSFPLETCRPFKHQHPASSSMNLAMENSTDQIHHDQLDLFIRNPSLPFPRVKTFPDILDEDTGIDPSHIQDLSL